MDIYKSQWESEIKMFLKAIENGTAEIWNNCIAVEYAGYSNENDPRYIVYEFGADKLRDDHFCAQHSRRLTNKELSAILCYCDNNGVYTGDWEISFEISKY